MRSRRWRKRQSPEKALMELPEVRLEAKYHFALQNGQKIPYAAPEQRFRLYCEEQFYGVGACQEGILRLVTPLY